jgi:hypothetical protein
MMTTESIFGRHIKAELVYLHSGMQCFISVLCYVISGSRIIMDVINVRVHERPNYVKPAAK